jgi:hypothetical protein
MTQKKNLEKNLKWYSENRVQVVMEQTPSKKTELESEKGAYIKL